MSYKKKYQREVEDLLYVCKRLSDRMYVTGYGGNLSIKLENDLLLITPTLMNKANITAEDVVFIDIKGNVVEGKNQPTSEISIYLELYNNRPDIVSIIHCHPPYTNAFAITEEKNFLMRPIFPETCVEVGPVPVVPYGESLTQQLTDKNELFVQKYNAFLIENHGPFIMSTEDIVRTVQIVEILEVTSMAILSALTIGKVKELSKRDVTNLDNVMKIRKMPMIGAPGVNKSFTDLYF
jgi:L-fuculose-phosphate aldolase